MWESVERRLLSMENMLREVHESVEGSTDGRGVLRGVVRRRRRARRLEREVALLECTAEVEQHAPVTREFVVRDTPAA